MQCLACTDKKTQTDYQLSLGSAWEDPQLDSLFPFIAAFPAVLPCRSYFRMVDVYVAV